MRLDAAFTAAPAPSDFKERIDYWPDKCGLPRDMHDGMQRLRVWRNASEHRDAQRWRAEGPQNFLYIL